MASLITDKTQKSADPVPRNANERRILAARAGHAALNAAFATKTVQKTAQPTALAAASFLSGYGGSSNMPEAIRTKTAKADVLAALPERARRAADRLPDGAKAFLARVHEVHAKTGEHVSFCKADAASIMGLPADAAGRAVDSLVTAGLLKPAYNSLGGISGYVPGLAD